MNLPKATLAIFLISFFTNTIASNTYAKPFDEARDEYYKLLVNGKFKELEIDAQHAKNKLPTLQDGQPKLAAFYAGVSGCLTSGCRNILTDDEWKVRHLRLKEWVKNKPYSSVAKIALATYYLEYGWSIRGQAPSINVESASLTAFQENVEKSKVELLKLGSLGRLDPGWYASLLRVARSQGWSLKEFDMIYNKATHAFPTYIPFYFERATFLSPRWYGNLDVFKQYVNQVTKETYPFLGDTLYARLNWLMFTYDMFENGQTDWGRMQSGFERVIQDYPHPWNLNNFAKFSCIAKDAKTFSLLDKKIGGRVMLEAFSSNKSWYEYCQNMSKGLIN